MNDLKNSNNTKNMSYDVDVQLVAIKVYFMNEIYEIKREISQLKVQEKTGKCDSSEWSLTDILKSSIRILQEQNSFIKSELHQKQIIIEKLLDINKIEQKIAVLVMEPMKVTKGKVKKVVAIKWFISENETPIMNILGIHVMIATII